MKTLSQVIALLLCAGLLAACTGNARKAKYNRKIYLTEEDYLSDLAPQAERERREAPPVVESEYIFNLEPSPDQKNIYFYDDRQQPQVPGVPNDGDYKKEKRLWQKPKRYAPGEYGAAPAESATEESAPADDVGSEEYD
ncbi:hypothetical protein [Candidatus Avelusimicrobium faecicola]|uniref:hypothetical protein n=1 Tax=Candidatus Avelusimicrobium faecicola TaxID=3416205 RepID=UPI0015A1AD20|nr:hypothetical protein [Spirochaetota bacterium]